MDTRLKLLSYSSLLELHKCPRKFELYRLNSEKDDADPEAEKNQNVTFAYGHVIGEGIQAVLRDESLEQILFSIFLGWHADILDEDARLNKSIWLAIAAIQKFISLRENGLLQDYELLYYKGKPATELSFRISFPDGFKFRGYVDAVLRNKKTGKVIVLECKTTSSTALNPASYKNSSQAVGYSVVLDHVCPDISSYEVLYLVYLSKSMTYEQLIFPKTYLQRATWIQEILLDIETIKLYDSTGVYPMRGESCFSFFRECEYMNTCTLSTKYQTKPATEEEIRREEERTFDIELGIMDLITSQIDRNSNDT